MLYVPVVVVVVVVEAAVVVFVVASWTNLDAEAVESNNYSTAVLVVGSIVPNSVVDYTLPSLINSK